MHGGDAHRRLSGSKPLPSSRLASFDLAFQERSWRANQRSDGYRYASGIRNSVAIAWDPASKSVFVSQHGRDSLDTLWPDRFTSEQSRDNPAEEFFKLTDGDDYMWPYCYWDTALDKKILSPEYGGDGSKVGDCDMAPDTLVSFPAHWGPNDLLFYTGEQFPERYRGGAFIAFHGSWNRAPFPQGGYNVVFVPMRDGAVAGDWETFADGFQGRRAVDESSRCDLPSHRTHARSGWIDVHLGLGDGPNLARRLHGELTHD